MDHYNAEHARHLDGPVVYRMRCPVCGENVTTVKVTGVVQPDRTVAGKYRFEPCGHEQRH